MITQLSVIIPFFNAEKYFAECLNSIFTEIDNDITFEVICINDCSQDSSREIVFDFQQKYKNIYLIEHEKNKMAGAARNTGLMNAKGQYVWFVDADDFVDSIKIKPMLEIAFENQLDILEFNAMHYYREHQEIHSIRESTKVISGIDFIFDQEEKYEYKSNSSWVKFFSREFLLNNKLFYDEDVYGEDIVHSFRTRMLSKRYMFVNEVLYHYRFNPTSVTGIFTAQKLIDFYNDHLTILNELMTSKDKIEKSGYNFSIVMDYHLRVVRNFKPLRNINYIERRKFFDNISMIKFSLIGSLNKDLPLPVRFPKISFFIYQIISPIILKLKLLKGKIRTFK